MTVTILVADDSALIRAVVRSSLEFEGYRVVEAENGLSALAQCRQESPDAVLLDIEMPGLDGYQVLSTLKGDADLKQIPVVFLTSRITMDDIVAGLRSGAHDYLKKPFEPAELLARVGSAVQMKKVQDLLRRSNDDLDRLSRTDSLTGLFNRRHLSEELVRRNADSLRHGDEMCLLLFDIDGFKQVNDTYGHPAGDRVLRAFAELIRVDLRAGDVAGRWGGEEFLVILPRTDLASGLQVAERIRLATAAVPLTVAGNDIAVSVSVGCAVGPVDSTTELVELVDQCLYQAKTAGRNQVVTGVLPTHSEQDVPE